MGGDFAPQKTVHGAILAQKELPVGTKIILFGNKNKILNELKYHNFSENVFDIVDCTQVIDMGRTCCKSTKTKI